RRLRGLVADGRQPARAGSAVTATARGAALAGPVGEVTSGNFSPMLERGIALALVDTSAGLADGDRVTVSVRGRDLAATVGPTRSWPRPADPIPPGGPA
ncbi:MAG: glycine cleavage T C-terminal barrel domain-containing protein, partial [Acidimicrobiales bacterium]